MPKKILIVDDDPIIRETLTKYLAGDGYNVRSSSDGFSGFEELRSNNFDLAILDISMPQMNGFQVLAKIRGHHKLKDLPVVMLTSSNLKEDVKRSFELRVTDFIIKPPGKIEVLQRIGRAIRGTKPEGFLVSRADEDLRGSCSFSYHLLKLKKDSFTLSGPLDLPSGFLLMNLEIPIFKQVGIEQVNFRILESIKKPDDTFTYIVLFDEKKDRKSVQNWLSQQAKNQDQSKAS